MEVKKICRYDIDWLRVILFGLLIPFHVAIGVYWSTYGTDINPNIQEINETDELIFIEESNDYTAESISLYKYDFALDASMETCCFIHDFWNGDCFCIQK